MNDGFEAIILAGGLGTRLRSVVGDEPKAMAAIAGRPFLEYLVAQLRASGCTRAVLATGFRAEALERHFGDGARWGVEIEYSVESEPRGTAGALKLTEPLLCGNRWLLMNGDSLFDINLQSLIEEHARRPAPMTIALARVTDGRRYGRVTLAPDGMITAFAEKSDSLTPALINSGLYIIERSLLDLIPADRPVSLEVDVIPPLVGKGLRGVAFEGFFIDIGIPEDYARAQADPAVFDRIAALSPPPR
jgi:NDP-sugar pyrophosphorylase family protein